MGRLFITHELMGLLFPMENGKPGRGIQGFQLENSVNNGIGLLISTTNGFSSKQYQILTVEESAAAGQTRLTRAGQLLGDPNYVSPEQLRGEPVTVQTTI